MENKKSHKPKIAFVGAGTAGAKFIDMISKENYYEDAKYIVFDTHIPISQFEHNDRVKVIEGVETEEIDISVLEKWLREDENTYKKVMRWKKLLSQKQDGDIITCSTQFKTSISNDLTNTDWRWYKLIRNDEIIDQFKILTENLKLQEIQKLNKSKIAFVWAENAKAKSNNMISKDNYYKYANYNVFDTDILISNRDHNDWTKVKRVVTEEIDISDLERWLREEETTNKITLRYRKLLSQKQDADIITCSTQVNSCDFDFTDWKWIKLIRNDQIIDQFKILKENKEIREIKK
ncbi:hypothetical protein [Aliarcobacter butzleri]|uniref:hypothetical protein n=1 Tax=Aliarcobacter butzleri TaxID=28197 RepID=UPI0021B22EC9|nr:hypothetical protein [Aliarcobacter butzleri]MCT7646406.1 hypothetical protein [Aliarcobacter butzleri]